MESTQSKKFRGSRTSKILARVGMAAVGSAAVLSMGAAATPAGAATSPYKTSGFSEQTSYLLGLAHVNLQGTLEYNGHDVYQVGPVHCSASGLGLSVTWCGATGGGSGNLTFGYNETVCVPGPWTSCVSGGLRMVFNTSGKLINTYSFLSGASAS